MGLSQIIKLNYSPQDMDDLLSYLRYEKYSDAYILKTANCSIEIQLNTEGIYIHKSGDYFYYFGLLVERLGEISLELQISDT